MRPIHTHINIYYIYIITLLYTVEPLFNKLLFNETLYMREYFHDIFIQKRLYLTEKMSTQLINVVLFF